MLTEPLGTFLVFLLALLWVAAGGHFLRSLDGQRSRAWLGIALVLGGIGAALAGISYQAFSYELKCAGRAHCVLTNGFEIGYGVTQAFSVSAMLTAVAFACTSGVPRRALFAYSAANAAAYLGVAGAGAAWPSRTLLSFEVLLLFALPGILLVILLGARRFVRFRRPADGHLLVAALLLIAVQAVYFGYRTAGLTQRLWDGGRGFYFSENDALHVGMMLWLAYAVAFLGPHLRDVVAGPTPLTASRWGSSP